MRSLVVGQLRALFPIAPIIYSLTLAALIAAGLQQRVPVAILVRDPSQTAHFPPYVGLFSNIGVLLWTAGATGALLAAAAVRRRSMIGYLLGGGLITALLGLDDLFTLHEDVFPAINVSERLVLLVYGLLVVAYFLAFIRVIFRTDFFLLGLALAFFAASQIFDQGLFNQGLNFLLDDGLKLLGIVSWTTYYLRTALQEVRREQRS